MALKNEIKTYREADNVQFQSFFGPIPYFNCLVNCDICVFCVILNLKYEKNCCFCVDPPADRL